MATSPYFYSGIPLVDDPENFSAQGRTLDVSKPGVKNAIVMISGILGPISQI